MRIYIDNLIRHLRKKLPNTVVCAESRPDGKIVVVLSIFLNHRKIKSKWYEDSLAHAFQYGKNSEALADEIACNFRRYVVKCL